MTTTTTTRIAAKTTDPQLPDLPHAPEASGGAVALREAAALDLSEQPDIFIPIAEGLIATFRDMCDKIEAHYDRLMAPFKLAVKNAKAMKDEDLQAWVAANTVVGRKLGAARDQQRRKAAEEAAARQRELDILARQKAEETRKVQQRLLDEMRQEVATKKEAREIEQMQKVLAAEPLVVAPAAYVPPAPPEKLGMLNERRDYSALVLDARALYAAVQAGQAPGDAIVISANQVWLNKQATLRAAADGTELFPGVVSASTVVFTRKPTGRA